MGTMEFGKDYFLFSLKNRCGTILYNEIAVIEYQKPYIVLQINGCKLLFQMSLCAILEKLPSHFLLVNRKTVINIKYAIGIIARKKANYIQMDNEEFYKISIRKVSVIKKFFISKEAREII